MSDFRCPRYWWDGSQWRCQNLPNDYLSSYDFDAYCTNKNRCLECPYMDSEVREKVAAYKKEVDERVEEHVEEQRREYEADQRNKENDYSYRENNNTSSTTTYSSSDSSDTGCLSALFSLVVGVIGGILKFLWTVIKFLAVWFYLPMYVAPTLVGFIVMLSFAIIGLEMVAMGIAFVLIAFEFISIPYWIILFTQKRKRNMTWKETFKYYGKWFLKGPFAYKDMIA